MCNPGPLSVEQVPVRSRVQSLPLQLGYNVTISSSRVWGQYYNFSSLSKMLESRALQFRYNFSIARGRVHYIRHGKSLDSVQKGGLFRAFYNLNQNPSLALSLGYNVTISISSLGTMLESQSLAWVQCQNLELYSII